MQEGLPDDSEDAGLAAFLEDFEEDYYTEESIRGDSQSTQLDYLLHLSRMYSMKAPKSHLMRVCFKTLHFSGSVDDLLELLYIHCSKVNSVVPNIVQFQ